jgi:hypothetical protein
MHFNIHWILIVEGEEAIKLDHTLTRGCNQGHFEVGGSESLLVQWGPLLADRAHACQSDSNADVHTHDRRTSTAIHAGRFGNYALTRVYMAIQVQPFIITIVEVFGGVQDGCLVGGIFFNDPRKTKNHLFSSWPCSDNYIFVKIGGR